MFINFFVQRFHSNLHFKPQVLQLQNPESALSALLPIFRLIIPNFLVL